MIPKIVSPPFQIFTNQIVVQRLLLFQIQNPVTFKTQFSQIHPSDYAT